MTPGLVVAVAVAGYVTAAPVPDWLGLATPAGRDAIQLSAGCSAVVPGMNVLILDDDVLQPIDPIEGLMPKTCTLVQRVHMSDIPCARNAQAACDVAFS